MKSTEFKPRGMEMDELRQQVADLEIQEAEIERQLGNAETDDEARQITNDLNLVRNRLSEKREELRIAGEKEQARAEVIEERVHAEEIPLAIAGIDFTELPAEVITLIDAVVKADRRRLLNEHAVELEQLEIEARTNGRTIEDLRTIIDNGTADNNRLIHENGNLRDHVSTLNADIGDLRSKLANASTQIEEKDAEIERLKSEIEDYQRAKAFGERQTQNIIDITPTESADISAALEAVKKLYVKVEDYGSIMKVTKPDGTFELAKRQEVAEEWTAVDVPSFRPEDTDANATNDQVSAAETAATVEPPAFREEEPAVQTDVLHGTVASEGLGDVAQVTREEFQALVKRVEALEGNSIKEAA